MQVILEGRPQEGHIGAHLLAARGGEETPHGVPPTPVISMGELLPPDGPVGTS